MMFRGDRIYAQDDIPARLAGLVQENNKKRGGGRKKMRVTTKQQEREFRF